MSLHLAVDGGKLALERVAFDSEIFGIEVARVTQCEGRDRETLAALHREATVRARAAGFVHLSRRVDATAEAEISALERARYSLADVGVIFDHDLAGVSQTMGPGIKIADERDVERIVLECATIFRTSRYYHDPLFAPTGADELHRRWIWNCFRGRADTILVLEDVSAFVTCAVDAAGTGNIALFGVAPSAQGRGAGQRLLAGALSFFAARGARRVEVKTQATNYAAARMYERGGFRLFRTELTYACRLTEQA